MASWKRPSCMRLAPRWIHSTPPRRAGWLPGRRPGIHLHLCPGLSDPRGRGRELSALAWQSAIARAGFRTLANTIYQTIPNRVRCFRPADIDLFGLLFPGDANGDKVADFTDLGILLNHYNQAGTFATGDFDPSGTVDFTDLGILLNNYNQHAPVSASAAPVPEPSSLLLGCLAACSLFVAAGRKQCPGAAWRAMD